MNTRSRTTVVLALATVIAGSALAASETEGQERKGRRDRDERREREEHPWREEGREFREAQHEKVKAHMKAQHEAGKAFREAVHEEEDAYKAVSMLKAQRTTMHEENTAFFAGIHDENIAFLESMFAKYEVPEAKQTEIMEKIEGHVAERRADHEERYEKVVAVLDKLAAKEDLTKEDIRNAMKKLHKDCPRRRGGRGKGKGKGRGSDED